MFKFFNSYSLPFLIAHFFESRSPFTLQEWYQIFSRAVLGCLVEDLFRRNPKLLLVLMLSSVCGEQLSIQTKNPCSCELGGREGVKSSNSEEVRGRGAITHLATKLVFHEITKPI